MPEYNGLEISEPENVFFDREETASYSRDPVQEHGNSDELFYFEFDSSEWWEFAGPTTQPVPRSPMGQRPSHLFAHLNPELPASYAEEIPSPFYDQDNNSYSGSTVMETDSPELSIVGDSARILGGNRFASLVK